MSKSVDIDELLLTLIDGAFETPRWTSFLDGLRHRIRADYSSLVFRPPGMSPNTVVHLYSGRRSPPHVQQLYREAFYARDPLPYHTMAEGRLYDFEELLKPGHPDTEAYVRAVMAPSGMNAMRMIRLEASGVSVWLIATRTAGDFGRSDEALILRLAPYLRSVLRSVVALDQQRTNARLSGAAINRLNYGWIALDGTGRVLDTDTQGRLVLERSTLLRKDSRGRLVSSSRQRTRELISTIREIAQSPDARPRAMVLSREPWLDMLLVRANRDMGSETAVPAVIAYVHGDSTPSVDRCEQLAQLFDLLPSEARLALALGRGMSLADAAADLGLTIESVRTYSKRIYAKTGARGQADLVRFIHRSVLGIV
jgi:DNA-binding CsgD family transcriptional regulator